MYCEACGCNDEDSFMSREAFWMLLAHLPEFDTEIFPKTALGRWLIDEVQRQGFKDLEDAYQRIGE